MLIQSFSKKLLAGFITAIIVVSSLSFLSYKTIMQHQFADTWVSHTLNVINSISQVQNSLSEAEKIKVYYRLHHQTKILGKYDAELKSVRDNLHSLRKLVSDNHMQVRRIDSLIWYSSLIPSGSDLASSGDNINDFGPEESHWPEDLGNVNSSTFKSIVKNVIQTEKSLLAARKDVSHQKASNALRMIIIYLSVIIFLLVLLFRFIYNTFRAKASLLDRLQISESKFFKAFNNSGAGMALVSAKGEWIEVNPFLLSLFGYEKHELIKMTFEELTHPEDLHKDRDLLKQLMKGELESYRVEKRYFKKDGSIIWGMLSVSLIQKENETPRLFVLQIEDITAIKLLVDELEDRNNALLTTSDELKSKMSQLEEFNRIVAHNLRGPAGSIKMMLEMIDEENSEAEKEELLSLIKISSHSLNSTLVDLMQVLEIRLRSSIQFDSCDLNEILFKSKQMLQGEILLSKVLITSNLEINHISFPAMYMESLFYNMLSNSLKYRQSDVPLQINIRSAVENGKTKLTFEDNGLGIDLKLNANNMFKLNKVFHKGYNSRGVGLFITKNQLETHGASIEVESEPMVGTKFIITF
jgi:PAS domain S-box-containing protein